MSTQHRTAIVTGASGGIGRAVATRLAADGYAVVVHYAGNEQRATETVEAITAAGGTALAVRATSPTRQDVAALFDRAEEEFGGVDAVVHAAGIMLLSPLADADLDDLDRMLRTNLRGTLVVAQQAARRVRRGGAIVNFSSTVVRLALPDLRRLRRDQGRRRRADADPREGAARPRHHRQRRRTRPHRHTAVPRRQGRRDGRAHGRARAAGAPRHPGGHRRAVAFLAGPDGRWVNGQVLAPNGGVA